jgi:hypothetical protein
MGVDVLSSTHRRCCLLRVERHLKFAGKILVTLPRSGEENEKWPSLSLQSSHSTKGYELRATSKQLSPGGTHTASTCGFQHARSNLNCYRGAGGLALGSHTGAQGANSWKQSTWTLLALGMQKIVSNNINYQTYIKDIWQTTDWIRKVMNGIAPAPQKGMVDTCWYWGDSDLGFKVWGFRFRAMSINDPEPKTNSEISEGFLRSAGPWMLCKPVYANTNGASAGNGGMGHVANKWACDICKVCY